MKTAEANVQYPDSKDSIIASQAALLAQKDAQIEQLLLKYEGLQRQHTTLQHQIEQFIRRIYGRKSEKIDPNQLMFDSIVQESLAQSATIAAIHSDINNCVWLFFVLSLKQNQGGRSCINSRFKMLSSGKWLFNKRLFDPKKQDMTIAFMAYCWSVQADPVTK